MSPTERGEITMRSERTDLRPRPGAGSGAAGYTLIEAIVAMALLVGVLIGVLGLFDFNNKLAKAQVNVAEMQQSLRAAQSGMVRNGRMAGRGGLPVYREASAGYGGMYLPEGPAIGVDNNVPAGTRVRDHDDAPVVEGTDVLSVRGILSTPFYQINPGTDGAIQGAKAAGNGTLVIRDVSPTGVPQNLGPWQQIIQSGEPEAILLVSAGSDQVHAVVEAAGGTWSQTQVTLNFRITGGTHTEDYLDLSPRGEFPTGLRTVSGVGILEEYTYYIRDADPAPRLSRARFYPNTTTPFRGASTNAHVDVADNILDLQVAFGVDTNGDEILTDNGDDSDEWLFNAPGDTPVASTADWNGPTKPLYNLRITTLARTDRLDAKYVAPAITAIEDHEYNEPAEPTDSADKIERSYRRRLLETVIDLRNLT